MDHGSFWNEFLSRGLMSFEEWLWAGIRLLMLRLMKLVSQVNAFRCSFQGGKFVLRELLLILDLGCGLEISTLVSFYNEID